MKTGFGLAVGALAAAFAASVSLPASAQAIDIKISHATALNSTKGQTWEYFKKLAEERLGDRVSVTHYHSGQLYGQREGIPALQAGAIQLISPGSALVSGTFPKTALFGMPYLFNPAERIRDIADSPEIGGKIFGEFPSKGLRYVAFWLNGYRMFGNSKRPVHTPDEMEGIKVRVPGGQIYRDTFDLLGGNVVSVSWSEIVPALQQGVVDGIEPTANNWTADKLYELAPYVTQTNHMLSTYIVLTNDQWWNSLPEDVRSELTAILEETTAYNWRITQEQNDAALKEMAAYSKGELIELSPAELKVWADKVRPVYRDYESEIGKDILDAVYKMLEQG